MNILSTIGFVSYKTFLYFAVYYGSTTRVKPHFIK